jgi:hypothetical protein
MHCPAATRSWHTAAIKAKFKEAIRAQRLIGEARIQGPDGDEFSGRIYESRNQGGTYQYCQITVHGRDGDALSELPLDHVLGVRITGGPHQIEVNLSHGAV